MNSSDERSGRAEPLVNGPGTLGSAISRAAGFFGFWLVLTGADAADLAAGSIAAVAATWASLRLMPTQQWRLRPVKLAGLVLHFLRQSIAAGTAVALRALDPRLPLRPGFVVYQARLPPGTTRDAFCAIMSSSAGHASMRTRGRQWPDHSLSRCDAAGGRAAGCGGSLVRAGTRRIAAQ